MIGLSLVHATDLQGHSRSSKKADSINRVLRSGLSGVYIATAFYKPFLRYYHFRSKRDCQTLKSLSVSIR